MVVYKLDVPGDAGDIFVELEFRDGVMYIENPRIMWSSHNSITEVECIDGCTEGQNMFIYIKMKGGARFAAFNLKIDQDGNGEGSYMYSWAKSPGSAGKAKIQMCQGETLEDCIE